MKNYVKTMKTMRKSWKTMKKYENNEKLGKTMKNRMKTMRKSWKTLQKQWKNDEKVWLEDFDPTTAGSRISTQQLARGLRPIHPGYYNGALQRGTTTGNIMEKRKMEKMKKSYL